jgi:hypothetical protein
VHVTPAAQPTQAPVLLQTRFAPQEVPGGWEPIAVHWSLMQSSAPRPQGLPGGVHDSFGTQAVQDPPKQYWLVPQGVPSAWLPAGVHTGAPEVQLIVIFAHVPATEQSWPVAHAEHEPASSQTPPPSAHVTPVGRKPSVMHARAPPSHAVTPYSQAAGTHALPPTQGAPPSMGGPLSAFVGLSGPVSWIALSSRGVLSVIVLSVIAELSMAAPSPVTVLSFAGPLSIEGPVSPTVLSVLAPLSEAAASDPPSVTSSPAWMPAIALQPRDVIASPTTSISVRAPALESPRLGALTNDRPRPAA